MKLSAFTAIFKNKGLLIGAEGEDTEITSITCDSRTVTPGALFFVKGAGFKDEYLISAMKNGAAAIVSERKILSSLPTVTVSDVRLAMPSAADLFYDSPYKAYRLVGITGTKGKTTVANLLYNIFACEYGENSGIISSSVISGKRRFSKSLTTPEALDFYFLLNELRADGVKAAVCEISSQALKYDRVEGVRFSCGIYLNLSPDHISPTEHSDFNDYKAAKLKLMSMCDIGFVNADDPYSAEVIAASKCKTLYTFGVSPSSDFRACDINVTPNGSEFTVKSNEQSDLRIKINIAGRFNVINALAAASTALTMGISPSSVAAGIEKTVINGRMEIIENKGRTVIVDYAHNELSFRGVFDYINTFYSNRRKICLFGCVGNKAYDRREELPLIAGKEADEVILTSDDPAFEDPEEIMREVEVRLIASGVPYKKITDREEAVRYAVSESVSGDVIFLAGKGEETAQSVKGKKEPYRGDRQIAIDTLKTL